MDSSPLAHVNFDRFIGGIIVAVFPEGVVRARIKNIDITDRWWSVLVTLEDMEVIGKPSSFSLSNDQLILPTAVYRLEQISAQKIVLVEKEEQPEVFILSLP